MECIVLGNSPRINDNIDKIRSLNKEFTTFGVNRIFLLEDVRIDYFLALDRRLWEYNAKEILNLRCKNYYVPVKYSKFLDSNNKKEFSFSDNPFTFCNSETKLSHGFTSVFPCFQIAFFLGFKKINVFGVDLKNINGKSHFFEQFLKRSEKTRVLARKSINITKEFFEKNNVDFNIF